jgi:NitT/TauT family transport system substrate-binding protein
MKLSRQQALATIAAGLTLRPAGAGAQAAPATIRIGAPPTEQMLPGVYAMRAGLFERAGIKIELTKMPSGAAVAAAIAAGALDIGNSSMLAIVLGHSRGVPFTIVAPSGLWLPTSEGGLVAASSSPLRTAKDFVGKTISAAAVNDINSLAMKAWMDQNGADSSSLKVVEIPQLAAPVALEQGRVDGITVTNPAFTLATSGGKARLVANIWSAISPRLLLVCWFSTTSWVERNRGVAERFSRVIAEAATYCNSHVEETIGDLVDLTGLDRSLVARMKRTFQTTTVSAGEVQPLIDVAAKYKAIEKAFPANEIIAETALK